MKWTQDECEAGPDSNKSRNKISKKELLDKVVWKQWHGIFSVLNTHSYDENKRVICSIVDSLFGNGTLPRKLMHFLGSEFGAVYNILSEDKKRRKANDIKNGKKYRRDENPPMGRVERRGHSTV